MLSDALGGALKWLERHDKQADRDDQRVKALTLAVNQTKRYIAARERGEEVDRTREGDLVVLWTDASIAVRQTDSELAHRLQLKAEYWANPDNWTDDEVRAARIKIEEVAGVARASLRDVK